jgi:hypothetical protein
MIVVLVNKHGSSLEVRRDYEIFSVSVRLLCPENETVLKVETRKILCSLYFHLPSSSTRTFIWIFSAPSFCLTFSVFFLSTPPPPPPNSELYYL